MEQGNKDLEADPDADKTYRTYVPQGLLDSFHLALGRFIQAYALVETNLNVELTSLLEEAVFPSEFYRPPLTEEYRAKWHADPAAQSRSQREAGFNLRRHAALRAVLKSKRTAELRGLIKDLLDIANAPDEDLAEVERIFEQLAHIHKMRDRLAHNGAMPDLTNKDNWFYTTDISTVNLEEKWSFVYFKIGDLDNMTRDLGVIPVVLSDVLHRDFSTGLYEQPEMNTPEMLAYRADVRGPFYFKASALRTEYPRRRQARQGAKGR